MSDIGVIQIFIPDWIHEQNKVELLDTLRESALGRYVSYKPLGPAEENEALLAFNRERLRCVCITDVARLSLVLDLPDGHLPENDPRRDDIGNLLKELTYELVDIITMDADDETVSNSQ